jgi:response regulator RpfG family c-di-GMP phosphodiesterase
MAQKILLVEDSATQALEVKFELEEKGFVVDIVHNGQKGLDQALTGNFDLILLDYYLPGLNGLEIVGCLRNQKVTAPVVVITGSTDAHVAVTAMKAGVADYIIKDENYTLMLPLTVERVLEKERLKLELEAAQSELKNYMQNLEKMVEDRTHDLEDSYHSTLDCLIAALDAREHETQNHSQRVAVRTVYLARRLGVSEQNLSTIAQGALMHDVGKIGVPDPILLKPGPLTPEEWLVMKTHPGIGYSILKKINFLGEAREIVFAHQERFDGSGYPNGMKRDEIPLGARIFAVIDTFDAITNDRPYRKARPYTVARQEITAGAGTQFDPEIVRAFLAIPESELAALSGTNAADYQIKVNGTSWKRPSQ